MPAADGAGPGDGEARYRLADVFRGVSWTPSYLALLLYIFITISYEFTGARAAAIVALVALVFQSKPLRLPRYLIWFGLFVIWAFISTLQSSSQSVAFDAALELGRVWIVAFVAVNAVRTAAQVRFFILFLLGVVALYPLRGVLFNFFIYHASTQGRVAWNHIFENPNDLAALLLVPLSLCLGIWATERRKQFVWWASIGGIALIPLVIVFTQSRGATLALLMLLAFSLLTNRRRLRFLVGAAATIGVVLAVAPESAFTRLSTLTEVTRTDELGAINDEGSAAQRFEIWKVARTVFAEHPFFGVGPGVYPLAHWRTAARPGFKPNAGGLRDAHNTYLSVLAELGLPGFVLFTGMIVSVMSEALRSRRLAMATRPRGAQQLHFLQLGLASMLVAGVFGTYGHLALFHVYLATLFLLSDDVRMSLAPARIAVSRPPFGRRRAVMT